MGPHADDCLSENIGVETISCPAVADRFAASRAYSAGQPFENSRTDVSGLEAGMKDDPNQVALFFGKSDERFGLGLHHRDRIRLVEDGALQATFEFAGGFFCDFAKDRELVFEMEIEGARRITGVRGDGMTGDGVGTEVCEKGAPCIEKAATGFLASRYAQAGLVARRAGARFDSRVQGFTDGHVISDVNVSLAA